MQHSPNLTLYQTIGTIIGSFAGILKGGVLKSYIVLTEITASTEITANKGIDTAILAIIGATAGFLTTKLLSFIYDWIKSKLNVKKH